MKNTFYFLLERENKKKYGIQMRAMHIMAAIMLLVYAVMLIPAWDTMWPEIVGFVPAMIGIIIFVIWKKKEVEQFEINRILRIIEIGALIMASIYFYETNVLLASAIYAVVACIILVLVFIEFRIFGEHFIILTEELIIVPMLFTNKKIGWADVKKIVLKYDLLTFQFQDESFWQLTIYHQYDAVELAQFQEFLNRQLH
jgi:uncharacterized membrane protein